MSVMWRLKAVCPELYAMILELESAVAMSKIALMEKRDYNRAQMIMHKKFPEMAESDLPLITKIQDTEDNLDVVKATLLTGNKPEATRIFKALFPKTPIKKA